MFDYRLDDEETLRLRDRFERVYIRTHPKPQPQTSRLTRVALVMLVVASIIVSSSHSIPAFLSTIEFDAHPLVEFGIALAVFTMVEVGMLIFAYQSSRRKAAFADTHINKQLRRGLTLAFVLALAANLHSVLEPRFGGSQLWGIASFGVFALVGLSAPTLAYIAGEVFGLTTLADEHANADADKVWGRDFDAAWDRALEQYRRQAVKVVRPQPETLPLRPSVVLSAGGQADADKNGHGTGQGYSKASDARARVREHLGKFPSDMTLNVRELADKLGVGKTTVADVKREMKANE